MVYPFLTQQLLPFMRGPESLQLFFPLYDYALILYCWHVKFVFNSCTMCTLNNKVFQCSTTSFYTEKCMIKQIIKHPQ